MAQVETLRPRGPYDLGRSLDAMASFSPEPVQDSTVFRAAVRFDGVPALMEVRQVQSEPPALEVSASPSSEPRRLKALAGWMLSADLDLGPFYELASGHPVLAGVIQRLHGVKPTRPPSLFQMAVIAITEQQISLEAAHFIRERLVKRFGDPIEDLTAFPTAESLAQASIEELRACGLSHRKSEYIGDLARAVVDGSVDLDDLKGLADEQVRSFITALRGFGPWSADYILVRGLGRPDAVPADDLGLRTIVGRYLGDGQRMVPEQVREALVPFAPYRGLTAFYLLADSRVQKASHRPPNRAMSKSESS